MSAADLAPGPAGRPVLPAAPAFRQFPVAWRFALRNQSRNRLAWLLLVAFVPAWYLLMLAITGHTKLIFRLFATGRVLAVDGGHLTLISAGLNSVTIIVGFAVFAAIRRTLAFDQRLIFAGYRQATLIAAKASAIAVVAAAVAVFTALVLLAFWRPGLSGWLAIGAAFTVIALSYGAFGLFLGVLVRNDLEGFFLIIMGGLMDTFLQNPLGNPLANKPVLEWFPSFGPTQFAVGGAFGHTALWGHLALGLAWPAAFAAAGLIIFWIRTRTRAHAAETLPGAGRGEPTSLTVLWTTIATSKIRADWSWPMPDKRSPEARYPPGQAVADELVDTVLAVSRALVAVAARSLAAAGDEVTLPQYRALVVLAARGPRGTAELAAALAVNPSTATRMCDRLVRKGLVRRYRQAGDRRAVRIALTATGELPPLGAALGWAGP